MVMNSVGNALAAALLAFSLVSGHAEEIRKSKAPPSATPRREVSAEPADSHPPLRMLIVKGATYAKVSLSSINGFKVKVLHSDGVADFALEDLTPAQVTSLNSTSATVRIDPGWKEKKRLADEAEKKRLAEEAAARRQAEEVAAKRQAEAAEAKRQADAAEAARARRATAGEPTNLREALVAYQWKWGPRDRSIQFTENGRVTGLKDTPAWVITGPRTATWTRLARTVELKFDEDFTSFQVGDKSGIGRRGALLAGRPNAVPAATPGLVAVGRIMPTAPTPKPAPAPAPTPREPSPVHWFTLSEALSDPYTLNSRRSGRLLLAARFNLPDIRDNGDAEQKTTTKKILASYGVQAEAVAERGRVAAADVAKNLHFMERNGLGLSYEDYEITWSNGFKTRGSTLTLDSGTAVHLAGLAMNGFMADAEVERKATQQRRDLRTLWRDEIRPALEKRVASVPNKAVLEIKAARHLGPTWIAFRNSTDKPLHNLAIQAIDNPSRKFVVKPFWFIPYLAPGRTVFTDPIETGMSAEVSEDAGDNTLKIEYFCDEGRMALSVVDAPKSPEVHDRLLGDLLFPGAKYRTKGGDTFEINDISVMSDKGDVRVTYTPGDSPDTHTILHGKLSKNGFSHGSGINGPMFQMSEDGPPNRKGQPTSKFLSAFNVKDGRCYLSRKNEPLTLVTNEPEEKTSIELAVAESRRAAVAQFPDLGKAGSKFHTEFLARLKTYQDQRPDYFRESSWPLQLAREVSAGAESK